MSAKIELLSEAVINQIAAGEVITRPACVVRELVQNAIDAHANVITIEAWQNPDEITKIRIRDNGDGIASEDLELAFRKHTTSKIKALDDIFAIQTLGFRGEALGAIASISHVKAQTSTDKSGEGTTITLQGDKKESLESSPATKGFDITVSRLFFNTPVRKKFLKSLAGEKIAIKEEVVKQILATESIEINYILYQDQRETFRLTIPTVYTLKDKILKLFKRHNLRGSLIPVADSYMDFKFSGYLTDQKCRLANRKSQYLFIGGRAIKDPIFFKTLERVYAHILPSRKYPMAFLQVSLPSDKVDINVHPTKQEVRFENAAEFGKALYTITNQVVLKKILNSQKQGFTANLHEYTHEATHKLGETFPTRDKQGEPETPLRLGTAPRNRGIFREHTLRAPASLKAFSEERPATTSAISTTPDIPSFPTISSPIPPTEAPISEQVPPAASVEAKTSAATPSAPVSERATSQSPPPPPANLRVLAQIEKCYIVFTLNGELYITDQHAAHERINYDIIMEQLNNKNLERMGLVVPLFFERNLSEVDSLQLQRERLNDLGVSIEAFSPTVVSVSEVPHFIPEHKLELVVSDLLDMVIDRETPVEKQDFYREIIARMACRMSVMSGDVLSLLEMENLILSLYEKNTLLTCPHGRPFVKKIASEELAQFFDRTRHLAKNRA